MPIVAGFHYYIMEKLANMYLSRIENYPPVKYLSRYFDVSFLLKFLLLMTLIYSFNFGYMSLVDARGYLYSSYLDHQLNYFGWLRLAILHTANGMVHLYGLPSYVPDIYTLRATGHGVYVGLECLGYGMMSFWLAFILAHDTNWQTKVLWGIVGLVLLWLLNCVRVALLLIAVNKHFNVNKWMDNHTAFNIGVYILTLFMIYGYYRIRKKDSARNI